MSMVVRALPVQDTGKTRVIEDLNFVDLGSLYPLAHFKTTPPPGHNGEIAVR